MYLMQLCLQDLELARRRGGERGTTGRADSDLRGRGANLHRWSRIVSRAPSSSLEPNPGEHARMSGQQVLPVAGFADREDAKNAGTAAACEAPVGWIRRIT